MKASRQASTLIGTPYSAIISDEDAASAISSESTSTPSQSKMVSMEPPLVGDTTARRVDRVAMS